MSDWLYKQKTPEQLRKWYDNKISSNKELVGFESAEQFKAWHAKQDKKCHYCGLKEDECQEIIHKGLLKSNRFPLNGVMGRGINRGYWLEVDRKDPNGLYSSNNCVLTCYFCNNDKSDIFNEDQFKLFNGYNADHNPRCQYLRKLLTNHK